ARIMRLSYRRRNRRRVWPVGQGRFPTRDCRTAARTPAMAASLLCAARVRLSDRPLPASLLHLRSYQVAGRYSSTDSRISQLAIELWRIDLFVADRPDDIDVTVSADEFGPTAGAPAERYTVNSKAPARSAFRPRRFH